MATTEETAEKLIQGLGYLSHNLMMHLRIWENSVAREAWPTADEAMNQVAKVFNGQVDIVEALLKIHDKALPHE